MNVTKILWLSPLIPQVFFILCIIYCKIKSYITIIFNSFYLLTINICILFLYHLSFKFEFFVSNRLYKYLFPIIFFFSYVLRIKRILNILSISSILKIKKIKEEIKAKLLYEKAAYSFEFSSLISLIIISSIFIFISYIYQITKTIMIIIEIISLLIALILIGKITKTEIKKKFKIYYNSEILVFIFLFSYMNISSEINISQKYIIYQRILFYLMEMLYILLLSISCRIFSLNKMCKENCLINKKLNSELSLFLNNELCFHSFNIYLGKNQKKSENIILLKLYFDINIYTLISSKDDKSEKEENMIKYINNNRHLITNNKLKQIFENIDNKKDEQNIWSEIYKIIYEELNKIFGLYKTDSEYKKLTALFDLIFYLDEFIFTNNFYFENYENEQLEVLY